MRKRVWASVPSRVTCATRVLRTFSPRHNVHTPIRTALRYYRLTYRSYALQVKADEPPGPTGYPVEFRALESFLNEPASKLSPEEKDNLVEMVTSYDPEAEFPVLFEFQGQRGVNVMRPQYPPRYIFERVRGKR